MKSELKIILEKTSSNKAKGNCFEDLIRSLLSIHQYEIRGNINFSGMEIDLICSHKHKSEVLYVECKAKEKVTSDELGKFWFNVQHKNADSGYFFRTNELEYQAGALLSEMKSQERYKNLTFFEPHEIIKMLTDANMVFEPLPNLATYIISKKILAVTHFGDFFIYLINESNAIPTKFIIVNAKNNEKHLSQETIDELKGAIDEIKNLEIISNFTNNGGKNLISAIDTSIEAISEVQESDNWYDYLPASAQKKHFVGRDAIRTSILNFFKDIQNSTTKKRIFYLNGKSGWGKSSLVLEIKDRCRNKHYKNKYYALAIDTRSAISDNFVALSLEKLIQKAITEDFLTTDIFFKEIKFDSNIDLLSSESMKSLLKKLKEEDKFLVLIFDQFEDVFRKKNFFKSFYKFLTDVTDKQPNLIVGFSWKSDFLVQSDDPAYHIWQQAKEHAREFTINEFGEKEIDGIIRQLEDSVGELDKSIKDRIKESSQGLPWLTKKLCIHIFDQIQSGLIKENLIESNLNIVELFKKDEERIESNELKALHIIAKRAYDGTFFDETDVGDLIESQTIASLLHKRLIIRSGANYNIYWDIFRDYLVTGVIPPIGESYLLRIMVNSCLDVFLLFEDENKKETITSLALKYPKGIGEEALYNIMIELRNIGLIQKELEYYGISKGIEISREGFIKYITKKFQNYTPYLILKKLDNTRINKDIIIQVLKNTFKQDFQDNTWDAYAKNLISWFLLSNLDIKSKLVEPTRGGRGKGKTKRKSNLLINELENSIIRSSIKEIHSILPLFSSEDTTIPPKFYRDLLLIGITDNEGQLTDYGQQLISQNKVEQLKSLKLQAELLPKMVKLKEELLANPKIKAKDLLNAMPENFFQGKELSSKILYITKATSWLK
ncbi:ATP-binding protein [Emticicia fluvialis]|uniref:ATP-binding protein n=1 Tax=Emticicia fluvialis TaxID=2974474 RepID=UPI002166ABA7|nr:ATP-binding protein [Emticicia fluvialis]